MKTETPTKSGIELIAEERNRQVTAEGWTSEHDDEHDRNEIAYAAIAYAKAACYMGHGGFGVRAINQQIGMMDWPADWGEFKASDDPIRNLVKAGALIAAEIDRLQRRDQP